MMEIGDQLIGTTAALITLAAVSAGSAVATAKIQSSAAEKAAKIQSESAKQQMDVYTNIWGQQQRNMAPYKQLGDNASALLASLMGGGRVQPSLPQVPQVPQVPGLPFNPSPNGQAQQPQLPYNALWGR